MTIEEVSERYRIPLDILKEYESWRLCDTKVMGDWAYDDQDIEWLDMLMTLYGIGFQKDEAEKYMYLLPEGEKTEEQRLSMLNQKRKEALDEVHFKEKQISQLDCLKHEIQHAGA